MTKVEIGSVLKRKSGDGPAKIEVVGSHAGQWITRNADDFGPTEAWTPNDLRSCYGADGGDAAAVDEYELFSTDAARKDFAKKIAYAREQSAIILDQNQKDALAPEQIFALSEDEQADLQAQKAKTIEQRLAEAKLEY